MTQFLRSYLFCNLVLVVPYKSQDCLLGHDLAREHVPQQLDRMDQLKGSKAHTPLRSLIHSPGSGAMQSSKHNPAVAKVWNLCHESVVWARPGINTCLGKLHSC